MSTGNKITKFYIAIQKRTDEWVTAGYPYRDAQERTWSEFFNGELIPRDYLEKKKVLEYEDAEREGLVEELHDNFIDAYRSFHDVMMGTAPDDLPPEEG